MNQYNESHLAIKDMLDKYGASFILATLAGQLSAKFSNNPDECAKRIYRMASDKVFYLSRQMPDYEDDNLD
jgi:hypothetical protein